MISYDYYKVFYYVCKYKNFTKAASVLSTSQSSISHTITNLESQLNCRLFTRTNRGISITPEGQELFAYVSVGCEQFIKGEQELSQSFHLENGRIRLGTTETALHCFLFDVIDRFHTKYPKVKIQIVNDNTIRSIQSLKEGSVDMSICATPFELSSRMRAVPLCEFQDVLIGGEQYQDLQVAPLSLAQCQNYPLISFSEGTMSRIFMERIFQSHHLTLTAAIESATSDLILPMVKHNLGLGFIPRPIAEADIQAGNVYEIKTKEAIPPRQVCLIYDPQLPQSMASKAFRKFLM